MKDEKTEKKRKKGLGRLLELAGSKKGYLVASIILSSAATILKFIPVIASFLILEEVGEHASNLSLIDSAYLFEVIKYALIAFACYGGFLFVGMMFSHLAAFNILYELRVQISEKLTKLSMGFFTTKASGEIKKIMTEDVEEIEFFLAHHLPDITSAIILPVAMITYLFIVNWILAFAAIIPLPLALVIMTKMSRSPELYHQWHRSLEKMNKSVVEYVRGMQVVKIFNASTESLAQLNDNIKGYRDLCQGVTKDYAKIYPLMLTMISSSLLFIVPVATVMLSTLPPVEDFIPVVLMFLIVGGGLYFPFFKLMFMSNYFQKITTGIMRIDEILYMKEVKEPELDSYPVDNSVEFENVSFGYKDLIVLDNVSFKASPNSMTALVGPSGAGKTTVGYLCARFWDVASGSIKIGGVDVRDMKTSTLMDNLSFLFQDVNLFFDTIEENIRMGNHDVTFEDVVAAAKAAQCHDFIMELPDGYKTLIGEGGTYLSGGEKQRIGIARVILKNAPILVLDEATAFADPENEGKILRGLSHLIKGKTVMVIAHRLSTITDADNIVVLDGGRVVEEGTHDDLVANEGLYSNMFGIYMKSREWRLAQK